MMLTVSTPCTVPNRGSVAGCRFTGLRSRTPPRPGKDCVVSFPRFPHEAAILARVVARQSQTVTKSAPFYHPSPVTGVGETHRLGPLHNLALLHRRRKSRHSDLALVNHVHTKRRHATSDGGRAPGLGHGGAAISVVRSRIVLRISLLPRVGRRAGCRRETSCPPTLNRSLS